MFARVKRIVKAIILRKQINNDPEQTVHGRIFKDILLRNGNRQHGQILIDGLRILEYPPRVIETVNEVILRRDYEFRLRRQRNVLIDIGMNVGITSILKASDDRFVHVYGFEPLTPTYTIARKNIDLNPQLAPKISTFNFGLSDEEREVTVKFSLDEIMSASSEGIFDTCFPAASNTETIRVLKASEVLEPIIGRHADDDIFLKLDCEGAEFKIMYDLNASGLLRKVKTIIVEWHGREPSPILDILTTNNFFYFVQQINVEWNVGLIRAVALSQPTEAN